MCTDDEIPGPPAVEGWTALDTPLDRLAAALGHPVTIFTDGTAVEPRLAETAELLRLWSRLREPANSRRVLDFLATIVAEQDAAPRLGAGAGPSRPAGARERRRDRRPSHRT